MSSIVQHAAPDDVLTTDRLTERFSHVTAVNAVSFSIVRGEAFGILGRDQRFAESGQSEALAIKLESMNFL